MSEIARLSDVGIADLPQAAVLARLETANVALEQATQLEEVKDIRDKIAAIEGYYRQQKASLDIIAHATIMKVRAEHKLGTMLRAMPKHPPGPDRLQPATDPKPPSYSELGIEKTAAHRWQQVATIPREELEDRIRDAAAEGVRVSVSKVLKAIHKEQQPKPPETPPLPDGIFDLILADPAWPTTFRRGTGRDFENHYAPMELEAIKALGVPKLAAPDCVLFLWAVSMLLPEALEVMQAWGFTFKASAVWVKDKMGQGYYWRLKHEYLLVGTRGKPGSPAGCDRYESVIYADRGEHSEKPVEIHEMIETMYPNAQRIELFARAARPGWALWGAEAPNNG